MKIFRLLTIVGATLTLAACNLSHESDSSHMNYVTQAQLASGSTKIGYLKPEASWQCQQVAQNQTTWSVNEFEGMAHFGGGYDVLKNKAVDYANKNNISANYIYLYTPSQTSVENINFTALRKATITYYQCQTTPPIHDSLF